jgi:hypothetical protein
MMRNAGLAVFVAVVLVNVAGLLLDLCLERAGYTTVTALVRAQPLWGVPILGLQVLGGAGLGFHFWGP